MIYIYVSLKSKFVICTQELESEREVIYPPPSPPPPPSPEKDVDIPSEEERLSKTLPENSTSPVFGDGTKDPNEGLSSLKYNGFKQKFTVFETAERSFVFLIWKAITFCPTLCNSAHFRKWRQLYASRFFCEYFNLVIGGLESRLCGCFRLFAPKFWEIPGTYGCYFVTL